MHLYAVLFALHYVVPLSETNNSHAQLITTGLPEAEKKLKTTSGWYKEGNGTDEYSFAALPAGNHNYYLLDVGYSAIFWTATRYSSEEAYYIYLSHNHNYLHFRERSKYYAFSVRCVKN